QDYEKIFSESEPPGTPPCRRLSDTEGGVYLRTPAVGSNNAWFSSSPALYSSDLEESSSNRSFKSNLRRRGKLKQRKAYYNKSDINVRSRSLTQLDDMDDGGDQGQPTPLTRRRKLSSAGKEKEAVSGLCERRGFDIDSIEVYLDNNKTPLPLLTSETSWLSGRTVRIKGKDDARSLMRVQQCCTNPGNCNRLTCSSNNSCSVTCRGSCTAPNSRKTSASYRGKQRFFNSLSVEEAGGGGGGGGAGGTWAGDGTLTPSDGSLKVPRTNKQGNRWSGLWGGSTKDLKMEDLVVQLDNYSRLGIPKLHHLPSFVDSAEDRVEEALYSLEEDWTDIVDAENLSEKVRNQQTALWELINTELAYIRTLKVIQDLFLNCLCNLQNNQILTEINSVKLFCNIPEIYSANKNFWLNHILPLLQESRESRAPLDPTLMKEGFTQVCELFSPYYRYCVEQAACQQYCKQQDRDNQIFKAYLAWCETQRDCNRLRLVDILVRPMQRLTKYSLLLKAVLKNTEDLNQRKDLLEMDRHVETLVRDVNSHMRQRQEMERLRTIIAKIDSYEPIETKDEELQCLLASSSHLDLTASMPGCFPNQTRQLIKEGDLKLREGSSSKIDVHILLFTDMILICKYINKKGDKVKVIKQPYILDRLVIVDACRESSSCLACVYLNEYKTAVAAFTLSHTDSTIIKSWKDQLDKARDYFQELKVAPASSVDHLLIYEDEEDEYSGRMRRRPSRRGSHYSSLAHSHSGSIELQETLARRDPSLELSDARANSFSSEDSTPTTHKQRASSLDIRLLDTGQFSHPTSPRSERKLSPNNLSPHTLSVEIPLGVQLVEDDCRSRPRSPVRSSSPLSPLRGISYPPLSPKLLKRGAAVQSCTPRTPPLLKSRHLNASVESPNITVISDSSPSPQPLLQDTTISDGWDSSSTRRLSWSKQDSKKSSDETRGNLNIEISEDGISSNSSLSLVIPLDKEAGSDRDNTNLGLVKVGGRSAPPSPLLPRTVNSSVSIGRQCATPPIPPRQNPHVSTTYISQDRHTFHVTAPESDTVQKHILSSDSKINQKKKTDLINPEIKINLADCLETVNITISNEMTQPPEFFNSINTYQSANI
ncbi:pleckstrin homology domain-containing family G member 5, partial [Eurytemora carolleeae]|uniref:pleckstrin homology domain-containing family G member 5 n=1 Tax=Eurytemora carolleeae TaxID=1294199 RepID=UPI000C767827